MEDKTRRALNVFRNLSDKEKKEFLEKVNSSDSKKSIEESITHDHSLIMGPLSGVCPYCGRK